MNSALRDRIRWVVFVFVFVSLYVLNIGMFLRFFGILTVSYITVLLIFPLYEKCFIFFKSKTLAVITSFLLFLCFVLIPSGILIIIIINEVVNIINSISFSDYISSFSDLQSTINNLITSINQIFINLNLDFQVSLINLSTFFRDIDTSNLIQNQLIPFFRNLATFSIDFLFNFFIYALSVIFILPEWKNIPTYLSKISPLDDRYDIMVVSKINITIKNVLLASFGVSLLQSTAVLIPMLFLNVNSPILLWIVMVLMSIVPIGSGVVWFPVGLIYVINGLLSFNFGTVIVGVLFIIYSAIIINIIDAYFRPKFMDHSLGIHPLIIILSVIGGIGMFGALGLIYGPVLVSLLMTFVNIYKNDLQDS